MGLAYSAPRSAAATAIRRIAHPTDFTPASRSALEWATRLAQQYDAELLLIHVLPPPTPIFEAESELRPQLESALSILAGGVRRQRLLVKQVLLSGTDAIDKQILRAVETEDADLIVMGTQGRTGFSRLLIGSVAARIVARARCPVMVVHGG